MCLVSKLQIICSKKLIEQKGKIDHSIVTIGHFALLTQQHRTGKTKIIVTEYLNIIINQLS